jgi:hypothetical protein
MQSHARTHGECTHAYMHSTRKRKHNQGKAAIWATMAVGTKMGMPCMDVIFTVTRESLCVHTLQCTATRTSARTSVLRSRLAIVTATRNPPSCIRSSHLLRQTNHTTRGPERSIERHACLFLEAGICC